MPLDLNNPSEEPTLGLCVGRELTSDEKVVKRINKSAENIRDGLRQNHYDGAGVRKIKLNAKRTPSARASRTGITQAFLDELQRDMERIRRERGEP